MAFSVPLLEGDSAGEDSREDGHIPAAVKVPTEGRQLGLEALDRLQVFNRGALAALIRLRSYRPVDLLDYGEDIIRAGVLLIAVHQQDVGCGGESPKELGLGDHPLGGDLPDLCERHGVPVGVQEVDRQDPGAVRRLPPELRAELIGVHPHPTPEEDPPDPEAPMDLGCLGDLAEVVEQPADLHHPAKPLSQPMPQEEVPDQGLAAWEGPIRLEVVGPYQEPALPDVSPYLFLPCFSLPLGQLSQVVLHHQRLAIEDEPVSGMPPKHPEEVVEEGSEPMVSVFGSEDPLPIPMVMRDDVHRERSWAHLPGLVTATSHTQPCPLLDTFG